MKKQTRNDPVDRFCDELIEAAELPKGVSFANRGVAVDDVVYELARRGYKLVHDSGGLWFAEKASK